MTSTPDDQTLALPPATPTPAGQARAEAPPLRLPGPAPTPAEPGSECLPSTERGPGSPPPRGESRAGTLPQPLPLGTGPAERELAGPAPGAGPGAGPPPATPRPGGVPPGGRGPVGLAAGRGELVGAAGARVVVRAGQTAPQRPAEPPARARPIEGLLLGLAAGDAAGWPAARHRASRMPEWTRRLTRELDTFAEQNATTTLPVPIALNQPPEPLRLGPSDDAEWAAFVAESVLTAAGVLLSDLSRSRRMRAAIDLAWNALASEVAAAAERAPEVESAVLPLRARISVRAGLGNLATGLRPPATGHDNPHYFDDAACVRACVLAVVHPGDARAAADLAEFDARYTQDGDGVHGARAMAAAIATALSATGADDAVDAAVDAALAQLPEATEIGRNARHAVRLARTHKDGGAFAIVPTLEHEIVDHVYSYGIAAAETVPVALALATAARGRMTEAVPAAACLSRVADSAPALAGALTGVLGGGDSIPAAWREACRTLSGCALPRLAGTDLVELAALLAATELTSPKG
ncbi:ADP-ribosylglycohydrolase family protein [Streptomyces sp. NBC_01367]|uniref:ADP-ribosylglycohydrolase family protein n=1 Tax=Streptomyces sp. NBC_01367 TaxID=2903841 RepID=UPI00386332F0